MTEIKQVANDSHKLYIEVSNGITEVSVANFDKVYELLPDVDVMEDNKNLVGKTLLSGLRYVEPNFSYYTTDENRFVEDPKSFRMRLVPGSELDRALDNNKDCQALINDLFGHYSVSLRLVKFLLEREHFIVKKNKQLVANYESVLKKCNDLQARLEVNDLSAKEMFVKKESYLALTPEEKVMPTITEQPMQERDIPEETEENWEKENIVDIITPIPEPKKEVNIHQEVRQIKDNERAFSKKKKWAKQEEESEEVPGAFKSPFEDLEENK